MTKKLTSPRIYVGLLLILVSVVYIYRSSIHELHFRINILTNTTEQYVDEAVNSHAGSSFMTLPKPKAVPNIDTVLKALPNKRNNTKSPVQPKKSINANANLKSKVAPNMKIATNIKTKQTPPTKPVPTVVSRAKNKAKGPPNVKAVSKAKMAKQKPKTNYLIYLCDSKQYCGGLGDRQRGITYAFMASIQFDRKFGIIMSTPCDVRQFMIPNKYNWIIPESDLIGKPQKIINSVNLGSVDLSNDTTQVIYLRTNSPGNDYVYRRIRHKLPPYLKGGTTRAHIFKLIWESLMKPSRHILNHLKTISVSKNMTCAHIRIGKSKNLPNDPARNNVANVPKLWAFMEKFDKTNSIFVATDNNDVRQSARQRFGQRYFDSEGKIIHIDRQKGMDGDCVGFETAIIDQIILSKCSVLIISFSQFSVRAAYLRNTTHDLYSFHKTDIKPFKLP